MSSLAALVWLRAAILRNKLRHLREHSLLKIGVVTTLGGGFCVFLFFVSYWSFSFLQEYFGEAVDLFSLFFALLFFALLIMLVFSNAIISYSSLYHTRETEQLFTLPVPVEHVFGYKFAESALFSSWAFLLLGLPPMLAYGLSVDAGAGFYVAILAFFVGFVGIPASIGNALAMLFAFALSPKTRRTLLITAGSLGAIGAIIGCFFMATWRLSGHMPYFWMGRLLERLQFMQHPLLPSFWIAEGLRQSANGQVSRGLFFLLVIVVNSAAGYALCDWLARATYLRGWTRAQEGRPRRQRHSAFRSRNRWLNAPGLVLLEKDWVTFRRDPAQWMQCAILLGLLGLYFFNLRNLSYHVSEPFWKNLTSFLNLAASCLVLATLITRFVFPLFSLEGRRFWILGLAPIRREKILWGKFAFAAGLSTVIVEVLISVSNVMLGSSPLVLWLQIATVAVVCFALSGLAVGMSALYPKFDEDNPSKIVSSFGGTLTLILSLIYVVLIICLEAMPIHYYIVKTAIGAATFRIWIGTVVTCVLGLSLVAGLLPMALGIRAFKRIEL